MTRTTLPRLADRLPLGDGLEVSPFCVGAIRDRRMVPTLYDAGVNFFFVSVDLHWQMYEEARRGLEMLLERPGVRDTIVVAGVSYVTQPVFCGGGFLELLAAAPALERLDVIVAGGACSSEILCRRARYLDLPYARALGHRAMGASFHERATALAAINGRLFDVAFLRYNPLHPSARDDVFARLAPGPRPLVYNFRTKLPVVTLERACALQLDDDHWLPEASDYYRFALSVPEMSGILGTVDSERELDALVAGLARGPLDADEQAYMIQLAALDAGRLRVAV